MGVLVCRIWTIHIQFERSFLATNCIASSIQCDLQMQSIHGWSTISMEWIKVHVPSQFTLLFNAFFFCFSSSTPKIYRRKKKSEDVNNFFIFWCTSLQQKYGNKQLFHLPFSARVCPFLSFFLYIYLFTKEKNEWWLLNSYDPSASSPYLYYRQYKTTMLRELVNDVCVISREGKVFARV